jgi:hypothetical protein
MPAHAATARRLDSTPIDHHYCHLVLEIGVFITVQIGVARSARYREIRRIPRGVNVISTAIYQPINPVLLIAGANLNHDAEGFAGLQRTARVAFIQIACANSAHRNPVARPNSIARTIDDVKSGNECA